MKYKSGVSVIKKAMGKIEQRLERKAGLRSWFVKIIGEMPIWNHQEMPIIDRMSTACRKTEFSLDHKPSTNFPCAESADLFCRHSRLVPLKNSYTFDSLPVFSASDSLAPELMVTQIGICIAP